MPLVQVAVVVPAAPARAREWLGAAEDAVEDAGLARSVGADDGEEVVRMRLQADAGQGGHPAGVEGGGRERQGGAGGTAPGGRAGSAGGLTPAGAVTPPKWRWTPSSVRTGTRDRRRGFDRGRGWWCRVARRDERRAARRALRPGTVPEWCPGIPYRALVPPWAGQLGRRESGAQPTGAERTCQYPLEPFGAESDPGGPAPRTRLKTTQPARSTP